MSDGRVSATPSMDWPTGDGIAKSSHLMDMLADRWADQEEALRGLVALWRKRSEGHLHPPHVGALRQCANELEALLEPPGLGEAASG